MWATAWDIGPGQGRNGAPGECGTVLGVAVGNGGSSPRAARRRGRGDYNTCGMYASVGIARRLPARPGIGISTCCTISHGHCPFSNAVVCMYVCGERERDPDESPGPRNESSGSMPRRQSMRRQIGSPAEVRAGSYASGVSVPGRGAGQRERDPGARDDGHWANGQRDRPGPNGPSQSPLPGMHSWPRLPMMGLFSRGPTIHHAGIQEGSMP